MSLVELTDEQVYVAFATHYHTLDVNLQDLVNTALVSNPELIPGIMKDWQIARLNQMRARLRLFANQSATVKQLTEAFIEVDKRMRVSLESLKTAPERINQIATLINQAVAVGSDLLDAAKKKT